MQRKMENIFENLTFFEFGRKFPDNSAAVTFVKQFGLVPDCDTQIKCQNCTTGVAMRSEAKQDHKAKHIFRCVSCRASLNPYKDTWFDNAKISELKVLELTYCFVVNLSVTEAARHTGTSSSTAGDWYTYCREVCFVNSSLYSRKIGGPGKVVEVDESHLFTRKYHRGRQHVGVWVFGGVCRETREIFLVPIPNKTRETLWGLMKKHIAAGSIIHSDGARVYNGVEQLGFASHYSINHSAGEFSRHSEDGVVTTNHAENMWRWVKETVKSGRDELTVELYTGEFVYRKARLNPLPEYGQRFKAFLEDILHSFPGPQRLIPSHSDSDTDVYYTGSE